jgi:hypothetical protein
MAAMKDFIFTTAEYAYKVEQRLPNYNAALTKWQEHLNNLETKYGKRIIEAAWDIYDEVADRSGEAWELLTCCGDTSEQELKELYSRSAA